MLESSLVGGLAGVSAYLLSALVARKLQGRWRHVPAAERDGAANESPSLEEVHWEVKALSTRVTSFAERSEEMRNELIELQRSLLGSEALSRRVPVPRDERPAAERGFVPAQVSIVSDAGKGGAFPERSDGARDTLSGQAAPAEALAAAYLVSCQLAAGSQFEVALRDELHRAGYSALVRYVYRDAAHDGGAYAEDQAQLASSYVQQSIRVHLGGLDYLVPQPQQDSNFNDLTGFACNTSDRLLAKTGNLRKLQPALLTAVSAASWQVHVPGHLTFAA